MESVQALLDRFTLKYKLIRFNPETSEVAIKNWGKLILLDGGKKAMITALKEVNDHSLISYVMESIDDPKIRSLFKSFCH